MKDACKKLKENLENYLTKAKAGPNDSEALDYWKQHGKWYTPGGKDYWKAVSNT